MKQIGWFTQRRILIVSLISLSGLGIIGLALFLRSRLLDASNLSQDIIAKAYTTVGQNNAWQPVVRYFDQALAMVLVPAGCFTMGSTPAQLLPAEESCERFYGDTLGCPLKFADSEQPVHQVCFDKPFWISQTEITNQQYGSSSQQSAEMYRGPDWPRDTVSWAAAQAFCQKAGLRLPTEAEWEYAARGPDNLIYPWGNTFEPESVAFGMLNPVDVGDHPAGRSWVGANDLSGSILEWVADWYAPYPSQPQQNPQGPSNGEQRVARGGAWFSYAPFQLRAAQRYPQDPTFATSIIGFRCAGDFGS
jgi:formylglycine-generating enzyme required for sulfatase activity